MVRTLDRGEEMHSSLFKLEPKFTQSNLRPDSAKSPNNQPNMNGIVFSQFHQFGENEENFLTMGVSSRGLNFQRSQQEHQRQQQMQQAGSSQHRSANGSTLLNAGTNSVIFHYPSLAQESRSWMYQDQDISVSNGLVYQPNMMQNQRLINLEHQQFDQSLYGVPVSSSRGLPVTNDSQGKPDRLSMPQPQISINSSYCNGDQHNLLTDRVKNESSILRHNFHSQNANQVAHPKNEVALDPEEERILYGSDDNIWDAFGTKPNIGEESVNIFGNGGSSNGLASIQSGSWSALMLSAVAESSSNDATPQVLTSAGKQKSSNQLFTEVSAPHKFLCHPMGNVNNDLESVHNLQQPAQARAMPQQNALFGPPNFFGRAAMNSTATKKAQSHEIPGDAEKESSNRNISHQALTMSSSISRPTETCTSKNSSSSTQNKLELLHKVDQEKDHTYTMRTMPVADNATNQSHDAENSHRIHQLLRTQTSVSQGFGLNISPPFHELQLSQNDREGNVNSSYKIPGKYNIVSSQNMPEQAGNTGVREGLIPATMAIGDKRESSRHDFQHSAKTVQNIWTKVPSYSNSGQCQMLQSQTSQSPYQNILESSSTPSTQALEEPKLKEATSHLSKSASADHVSKVTEPLGKEPHMKDHVNDPPENSSSTHTEIKCFSQFFRPSSLSDQPYFFPNQIQASRNAHNNVINGETKIMERPDNLADATSASMNQNKPNSIVKDPLSSTTAVIIPEASKVMTSSGIVHTGQKKHKNDMFRLRPWHKEISEESNDRSTCSMGEAEGVEDSTPMLKSKRRLIRSSRLMQQLIGSPPTGTLSVDARSCCDVVTYSISRTVLGDAFSCVTNLVQSNSLNPHLEIHKPLVRNGAQRHEKASEELSHRAKRIKTQLERLEKSASSLLDLRSECGDLEKFSIMNRLVRFHAETASTNASSAKKPPPQRYCTVKLMPKDFPKSVECLSL